MKDYSKMSDFEICGYVSMHEHGFSWIEFDDEMSSHVKCGNEGSPGFAIVEVKDYCNNPSDAWPIIVENSISIVSYGVEFSAEYGWSAFYGGVCVNYNHEIVSNFEIECSDKNPLRAAMIVYLMMKDEEK